MGSLALTPPSSSAATKGCGKWLASSRQRQIPRKDGNPFPCLSQQWRIDAAYPCPPPRSAIAITLRGRGMLSTCGLVQWETGLPQPAPSCHREQSSPFGGSTWWHGRVLLARASTARC